MTGKLFIKILVLVACFAAGHRAAAQHFIGASTGYSLNSMSSSIYEDFRTINSWKNYGLIYKYYRSDEWLGKYVGLQAGLNYTEKGYQRDSVMERRYQAVEVPFMAQLHYQIWKLRAIGNAGLYGAYLLSAEDKTLYPPESAGEKTAYTFQSTDNRFEYGLRFGAGLGLMLHPVEIQFEFNYSIGLSYTHQPVIPGSTTVYNRFTQMVFSMGVLIEL